MPAADLMLPRTSALQQRRRRPRPLGETLPLLRYGTLRKQAPFPQSSPTECCILKNMLKCRVAPGKMTAPTADQHRGDGGLVHSTISVVEKGEWISFSGPSVLDLAARNSRARNNAPGAMTFGFLGELMA